MFLLTMLCIMYLRMSQPPSIQCSGIDCTLSENATMVETPTPNSIEPKNNTSRIPMVRILIFALLATLAILPRLWLGARATAAYGQNMISAPWHAVLAATWYLGSQDLCPLWLQWIAHFGIRGAPHPGHVAGAEFFVMSFSALGLGFHPALAYSAYLFADAVVHPLRRQLQALCDESELIIKERRALVWFGRSYFIIGIFSKTILWLFVAVAIAFAITTVLAFIGWVLIFAYLPVTFAAESIAPKRQHGRNPVDFSYTPLKDNNTIRLLRINPSVTDALPVRCSLLQVPLGGWRLKTPAYVAMSHKWPEMKKAKKNDGNSAPQRTLGNNDERGPFLDAERNRTSLGSGLIVNGCPFPVHLDILTKLRDVRSGFRPVCVWIDNICIDQQNEDERGQQVALMNHIYDNANHVVACLVGLENVSYGFPARVRRLFLIGLTPDEQEVYDVDKLLYRLRDTRILQDFSGEDDPAHLLSIGERYLWDALYRFFSNEWFGRVWMLQEVTMAKRLRFRYCGSDIDWDVLTYALAALRRSGLREFRGFRQMEGIQDADLKGAVGVDSAMIYDNLRRWR